MVCLARVHRILCARVFPICISCGLLFHLLVVEGVSTCEVPCSLPSSGVVTYRAVPKEPNPSTSSGLGAMAHGTRPASPVECVPRWPAPSGSADMASRQSSGRKMMHVANGKPLTCHVQYSYKRRFRGPRVHRRCCLLNHC